MQFDFPEPEAEARAHSAALTDHIRQAIESAGGWISFAEYMNLALYAPGQGYYSAGAAKLGAAGDFVTAPELSPLFSECLAGQCAQVLRQFDGGVVLEPGAGQGTMAADMLLELERLDCLPDEYLILELSADLRERQRRTIRERAGHLFDRVKWLDRSPTEPVRGVIVANEVVDALPVHRFVVNAEDVSELGVGWQANALVDAIRPASPSLLKNLRPVLDLPEFAPAPGYLSEISCLLPGWVATLSDWLETGMALLIDYGFSRPEYYRSERSTGTLRCYYQHRAHDDPYLWPGLQDISSWVDFSLLAESAAAAGLAVGGYTTQAHFLLASGINERFEALASMGEKARVAAAHGVRRLLLPGEMGETVKFIALTRGAIEVPDGMLGRDLRSRL